MTTETTDTRLEQLLAQMAQLEAMKTGLLVEKAISGKVAEMVTSECVTQKLDIKQLHGKYFSLSVGDAGKLEVTLVAKINGKSSNGTTATTTGTKSSNGNGKQYALKDGRKFDRVVDAIEALTGKPCTIKHDGKNFEDGKPVLRYARLTKELKNSISEVDKPKTDAGTGDNGDAGTGDTPPGDAGK